MQKWIASVNRRHGIVMMMLFAFVAASGCSTTQVAEPLTERLAANDDGTQMEFWHTLHDRDLTSNDEAFHGLLLYFDGVDPAESYQGRVDVLKSRGWLHPGFDRPADEALRRGTLAVIVYHALDVPAGLMSTLLPRSPRYTMRQVQYAGLFPPGSPHQPFTGAQFVSIVGRMEDYRRIRPTKVPAKQLQDDNAAAPDPVVPVQPGDLDQPDQPAPNDGDANGVDGDDNGNEANGDIDDDANGENQQ